jgi:hypothetical protein
MSSTYTTINDTANLTDSFQYSIYNDSRAVAFGIVSIIFFLLAVFWVVVAFLIGWFAQSLGGVIGFTVSFIIIVLVVIFLARLLVMAGFTRVFTVLMIVGSLVTVYICGHLLGLGAVSYRQYTTKPAAEGVTLYNLKQFDPNNYSGYYFDGHYSIALQMTGFSPVTYSCGQYQTCTQYLFVAPLVEGDDTYTWYRTNATVQAWIAAFSFTSVSQNAFPETTFSNEALSKSPQYVTTSALNYAIRAACQNVKNCGTAQQAPIVYQGDISSQINTAKGIMTAGYVIAGILVPLLCICTVSALVSRLMQTHQEKKYFA